jgi:hypothetical protein
MKNRITKKAKQQLKTILDNTGYWSKETREYLETFDYITRSKLHSMAQVYEKYGYGLEV